MRFTTLVLAAAATVGSAVAQNNFVMGFNSGASDDKGAAKSQQDFETEFKALKTLPGAAGNFTAVRLYSNIQWNTPDTPIAAFPAAISTGTKLLLGIWASGTDNIDNELNALTSAIKQYGTKLTDLVIGISVGSEDLYRVSEPGIKNKAGVGNGADNIVKFIKTARERLSSTTLKNIKVTHVDTWTAWVNSSNKAVIDNVDFVSVNAFPFYESEHDNRIDNAASLLSSALSATEGVAQGKDVWITETGWAYTGPNFGAAQSTTDNAAKYWQDVGCAIFGKKNVFWYTLRDSNPANQVKFAIADYPSMKPRFELSCPAGKTLPSASSSNSNSSSSSSSSNSSTSNNSSSNSTTSTPGTSNNASTPGSKNAASAALVSQIHSVAMALSVVFAVAAWAL